MVYLVTKLDTKFNGSLKVEFRGGKPIRFDASISTLDLESRASSTESAEHALYSAREQVRVFLALLDEPTAEPVEEKTGIRGFPGVPIWCRLANGKEVSGYEVRPREGKFAFVRVSDSSAVTRKVLGLRIRPRTEET